MTIILVIPIKAVVSEGEMLFFLPKTNVIGQVKPMLTKSCTQMQVLNFDTSKEQKGCFLCTYFLCS